MQKNQQSRQWPIKISQVLFKSSFIVALLVIVMMQSDASLFVCSNDTDTTIENQKTTFAREALEQRKMMRASEDGTIPFGALVKAKEHIDEMPAMDDAGIWDWEWLGPGNIGGRIRAILIHPDDPAQIWIGSASGGIWKSNNGGGSWAPVNDFMANLAITSIVMDPVNKSIMYAATGEGFGNGDALQGAGIFKSTNGGLTWNQLASTNNASFYYVNRLAHHPYISGRLFAVTASDFGAWQSDDYGATWNKILGTGWWATDIRVHPTFPQHMIVGTRNEVYLSGNNGMTWEEQTTGVTNKLPNDAGRCEVIFSPTDPDIIYVSMDRDYDINSDLKGEIWRSLDGGDTWELRCTGWHYLGKQGWYDNTIWVDPTNSDHLVVGGIDLWRSTDGGRNLIKISNWSAYHIGFSAHADHHIIVNHPDYDGETNLAVFFGNDGGIQKTDDITEVSTLNGWTNLAGTSLGITQFYGGAAAPDGSIIVGGTQDNDKLRYKPATGTNWYQATTGDGGFSAVNYNDPAYVFGEFIHLKMKRSMDGGQSYGNIIYGLGEANNTDKSLFIAPFVMDPNNPVILIAGGASLWRTTSSTNVWLCEWTKYREDIGTFVNGNGDNEYFRCSAIDIAKGNSGVVWAGYTRGVVSRTLDNGDTWTRVDQTSPYLPDRYVTDIAINPKNSNEVFVTFGGYEFNDVWYTTDAGATWQQRTGTAPNDLPAIQVNTIRFHPTNSDWIYIGTDLGIFASEDRGLNWNITPRNGDHDGPANVEVSELFWQADYLVAASHGRGMYRCRPLDIIYVDKSTPETGNGSLLYPYKTVAEAENAAGPGSQIMIYGNTYDEEGQLIFHKRGLIKATEGPAIIK